MTGESTRRSKRDGLEGDVIAGLAVDGQRGAELPAFGKDEIGVVGEILGGRAGRVEGDFVPLKDKQLVGGRDAVRLDEVVGGVELGDAGRNVEMEGEDVEQVALPGNLFAVRPEVEAV